jgi:hypothetical protein
MPNLARSTFRGPLYLSAPGALACADSTPAGTNASLIADPSASTVSIMNDGTVPPTDVKVSTSERDVLPVVATINPGQTVGPFPVSAMHTDPMIQATVQGRTIVLHPAEGFPGFNPPRAAGPTSFGCGRE